MAGENFVEKEYLVQDIIIRKNDGYDGQFFYRYALNPFSRDVYYSANHRGNYGIKVDHLKYRRSRLTYPLAAWLLAFGQQPLIPYTLILVNIIAFILIIKISVAIIRHYEQPIYYAYFPLFIMGLYMGVARDLSDTLTCCLLAAAYLAYIRKQTRWFLLASTGALFCRESSAFVLIVPSLILFDHYLRMDSWFGKIKKIIPLFLPYLLFLGWSIFLSSLSSEAAGFSLLEGLQKHFGLPFQGMYQALTQLNVKYSLWFSILRRGLYIFWTLALFGLCLHAWYRQKELNSKDWLYWSFWVNLLLILSYAYPIYVEPWSFVRVLAPAHLFCFFFLLKYKVRPPYWFIGYSFLVLFITSEMLILRL